MRITIVDDCVEMLDKLRECVVESVGKQVSEIKTFQSPLNLLNKLDCNHEYDIYLLDIEMEPLNGLELAKKIRNLQQEAFIVFITSHGDYALNSYDIQIKAYQYILKDAIKEKLPQVLREILHDVEVSETEYYVIQNQRRTERIKLKEITKIHKEGKNAVFVTADGDHFERKALNDVMKRINRPEFIFIDQGIIVNIKQIRRIEGSEVIFFDSKKVHISRANIQKVKREVSEYWGVNL